MHCILRSMCTFVSSYFSSYPLFIERIRIISEHVNRSLKIFKILRERYRNRRRRFGLRCNLIAALYNYELQLTG